MIEKKKIKRISFIKKIQIFMHTGEAKAVAPLTSLLGQFGLNCPDFCQKFNEETSKLEVGIPIYIDFYVLRDRRFEFTITEIPLNELVFSVISLNRRKISKLDFYKFYKLVLYLHSEDMVKKYSFLSLIGFIRSLGVRSIK